MKIAIVDDELVFREKEKQLLQETYKDAIFTYASTEELLKSRVPFGLVLLDIEMPDMDGLTFAKEYNMLFPKIIFVTSYEDKVFHAFGANIFGFIKKDELDSVLVQKVDEVLSQYENTMYLDTVQGERVFVVKEILYFYYEYATIYVKTFHETYKLRYRSMAALERLLDQSKFKAANRNIIVNISNIAHFLSSTSEVEFKNGERCKVSKRNKSSLIKAFAKEALK